MSKALSSTPLPTAPTKQEGSQLSRSINAGWDVIAPFWPLETLVAVNPLQGLENKPFEEALAIAQGYFQHKSLPQPMHAINRETIKWMQLFCDEGQATLPMPGRQQGLYTAWRALASLDARLHGGDATTRKWLESLPDSADIAISECALRLGLAPEQYERFFTLLLTTLPGWAAYLKYRTDWASQGRHRHRADKQDYLALRMVMACALWPQAKSLLSWHDEQTLDTQALENQLGQLRHNESRYRHQLLTQLLNKNILLRSGAAKAQLVFCIDVRSEPFRRALESVGHYETYGFAGFFGIPVDIHHEAAQENHACCPVLLKPRHRVREVVDADIWERRRDEHALSTLRALKRHYQSAKYTFTAPLALMETLGLGSAIWMALRSILPTTATRIKSSMVDAIRPVRPTIPILEDLTLEDQAGYAEGALRMIGLTSSFAPLVVFCGHGSATENNPFASALDCGACGGRHGGGNARILADILNDPAVRHKLTERDLHIPDSTRFIAAQHNTTTDEVTLFDDRSNSYDVMVSRLEMKAALEEAREINTAQRMRQLGQGASPLSMSKARRRSSDWAQVRPEWGLARNAAFIAAPRSFTEGLDLDGRCFLHSYDWRTDPHGTYLTTILTAPMVVAQWINAQYLFSTLDNTAFGAGSKVTMNVTGKVGVMQGNASDLMHGLPLQSVFASDDKPYHEPQRLMTLVYAPRSQLDAMIAGQDVLKKLFGGGWVQLACIEPGHTQAWMLQRDFTWAKA